MKKIVAFALALMMIFAIALAEEVNSVTEETIIGTDCAYVIIAPATDAVAVALVNPIANGNVLAELMPAEAVEAVNAIAEDAAIDEIDTVIVTDEYTAELGDLLVTFAFEGQYAEDAKIALLFVCFDAAAVTCTFVVEGIVTAEGTVSAMLDADMLIAIKAAPEAALVVLSK